MREMRGEVGKKPLKKEMDNPSFLWRHMADFLRHFVNVYRVETIYMLYPKNHDAMF